MATEPTKQPAIKPNRHNADMAFDVLGVGISAGAGLIAAWHSAMRNLNNRILKQFDFIGELESKRTKSLREIGVVRDAGGKIIERKMLSAEEFTKETRQIYHDYHVAKDTALAERAGIKGTWGKLKLLDRHGISETLVAFSGVTALAIGAVMAIRGIRNVSTQQQELEDRMDTLENQNQR